MTAVEFLKLPLKETEERDENPHPNYILIGRGPFLSLYPCMPNDASPLHPLYTFSPMLDFCKTCRIHGLTSKSTSCVSWSLRQLSSFTCLPPPSSSPETHASTTLPSAIWSAAFTSPSSLAVLSSTNEVRVLAYPSLSAESTHASGLPPHLTFCGCVAPPLVAEGTADGRILLWSIRDEAYEPRALKGNGSVFSLSVAEDGTAYSAGEDRTLRVHRGGEGEGAGP